MAMSWDSGFGFQHSRLMKFWDDSIADWFSPTPKNTTPNLLLLGIGHHTAEKVDHWTYQIITRTMLGHPGNEAVCSTGRAFGLRDPCH